MLSRNHLEYFDVYEVLFVLDVFTYCSFFALRKRSKAAEEIPEVGLAIDH